MKQNKNENHVSCLLQLSIPLPPPYTMKFSNKYTRISVKKHNNLLRSEGYTLVHDIYVI